MDEELLTPKEVARRLAVPLSWIYGMTRRRKATGFPVVVCGKYRRMRMSEVLRFLEKQQEARN